MRSRSLSLELSSGSLCAAESRAARRARRYSVAATAQTVSRHKAVRTTSRQSCSSASMGNTRSIEPPIVCYLHPNLAADLFISR